MDIIKDKNFEEQLCKIIVEAGKLLLTYLGKKHDYMEKEDGSFATEADIASEQFLIKKLGELLPEAGFLAEESGVSGNKCIDYCWVIDPIDGTTNFAHGFPYFGVNVALTYKDEPIIGVTYNSMADELFFAKKGGGAFLNGERIGVSDQSDMSKALVSLAVPCNKKSCIDFQSVTKLIIEEIAPTIRKLGSACLDLANIACGRLDVAVLKYVSWWDIAAGIVLVREAGGIVSEFDKDTINPDFTTCIASNKHIIKPFKELLVK